MRRHRFRLMAVPVVALLAAGLLGPPGPAAADTGGGARRVIVELSARPAIAAVKGSGHAFAASGRAKITSARKDLADAHRTLLARARRRGVHPHVERSLTLLDNAVAMRVPASAVATLRKLPGVSAVLPDERAHASDETSRSLIGAPKVWRRTDPAGRHVRGDGVTVAIVDTGVDYTHPDLGGGFGTGHKVVGGYDFVHDDADPADDNGHGTHVAGIVAARAAEPGGVTGVAPDAELTAYKVLDSQGAGWTSDIVAGLAAAVDPGNPHRADVVNLSLGTSGDGTDPLGRAATAAARAGVLVVAAAGNSGPGKASVTSPANAPGVLAVGASISGVRRPTATLTAPRRMALQIQRTPLSANPPTKPVTAEVVDVGAGTPADYERVGDVRGKIVLRRWRVPLNEARISTADIEAARADEKRGALAVIGYEYGSSGPSLAADSATVDVPVHGADSGDDLRMDRLVILGIDKSQYNELKRIAETGLLRISVSGHDVTDRLASFSSRGPSPSFAVKPDLVAPGVEIRSTVPSGRERMSGTSMAAPQVAGAAALLRQAHPDRPAAVTRAALVGTAHRLADLGPNAQGAGRLDVARAVDADVTADPASLALGVADLSGSTVRGTTRLRLRNAGTNATTADLTVVGAEGRATVEPGRVRVPAGGTAQVTVTVSAHRELAHDSDLAGWVTATMSDGSTIRVPYLLAERPLVVRAAPDPSDGSSTVFVYSATPLNAPPVVTVTRRHGRPVEVTARRDHGEWYRADVQRNRAGTYRVTATGWAASGQRLLGSGHLEVTARHSRGRWQAVGPNSAAWRLTTTPGNRRMGVVLDWTDPAPWITTDRGRHWRRAGRLPVARGGAGHVVIDPRHTRRMYLAVNGSTGSAVRTVFDPTYQGRILRTTDRGRTWSTLDFPDTQVYGLVSGHGGRVLAAVTRSALMVSRDHGESWTGHPTDWGADPRRVVVSGHDLFVATLDRIWKVAGFDTRRPAPAEAVRTVHVAPTDSFVGGLAADDKIVSYVDSVGVVWTSANAGASWRKRFTLPKGFPSVLRIVHGTICLGALGDVDYLGTHHGAQWSAMRRPDSGPVESDFDAWPGDDRLLVSQEDAGLYSTADAGRHYRRIGVPGGAVSDLAVATDGHGRPRLLAGGHGDTHGTRLPTGRVTPGTVEWGQAREGTTDTPPVYSVSPDRRGLAWKVIGYPAVDDYAIKASTDGGRTWSTRDHTGGVGYAVLASSADPDRVFVSMKDYVHGYGLRVTSDGGRTWKNLYQPRRYTALTGDPREPDRLWLGAADGLYRSDDGGVHTVKVADGRVDAILVNGSRVVVGGSSIRVSTDGGKHFRTADTGGLPMRVSDLYSVRRHGRRTLYASTTSYVDHGLPQGGRGVLRSTDGGRTWRNVSGGLGDTAVTSLAGSPDGRWLYAGTAHASVYRLYLR